MDGSASWKGLGRRLFDVYIQVFGYFGFFLFFWREIQTDLFFFFFFFLKRTIKGERVLQDLNILKEAGGPKKALIKTLVANVTNTALDIHLMWAGRGTCCIPFQSTYGPLVSAIRVSQGS